MALEKELGAWQTSQAIFQVRTPSRYSGGLKLEPFLMISWDGSREEKHALFMLH